MADRITTAPRPLLRRVLSFREPLLLIPYLAAAGSAFFHSYSSFLHSVARSLLPPVAKWSAYAASSAAPFEAPCRGGDVDVEEEETVVSREEVEEILERMGLAAGGSGKGLKARMGHADVSALFDADEPSFAEVRRAFAVFDRDGDGFIDAADLQGTLAGLGLREDAAACRAMIVATGCGGSWDARMDLSQFVRFLEAGLC